MAETRYGSNIYKESKKVAHERSTSTTRNCTFESALQKSASCLIANFAISNVGPQDSETTVLVLLH
jgi:hypothetical protein